MKFIVGFLILFFAFTSFGQFKTLSEQEIAQFKASVQQELQDISSLKANFIQKKHMQFLAKDIVSKGKMLLNDKRYLKWVYTSPKQYSILFKEGMVYIDDNGKQSTLNKRRIFKKISQIISGSLSGKLFDDPEFEVTFYKTKSHILVRSIPKNASLKKYISKVYLYFPKEGKAMVSNVKLVEPSGDYTFITFTNILYNVKIDSSIFGL